MKLTELSTGELRRLRGIALRLAGSRAVEARLIERELQRRSCPEPISEILPEVMNSVDRRMAQASEGKSDVD